MKRSQINRIQREAAEFFRVMGFHLPPWAFWSASDWTRHGWRAREVVERKLGWDVTDFGLADFTSAGLVLFTLRNGKFGEPGGKDYAEKIMIVGELQVTPWHFHRHKMEDIINRGGGNLVVEVRHSTREEELSGSAVQVLVDAVERTLEPEEPLVLEPGESITLPPRLYHTFHGQEGKGSVLVGEVSRVNDDEKDNRFLEPLGRFPEIEEDEPPLYCLCNEYPAARA